MKQLKCASCPYITFHHDYMINHVVEAHSAKILCYGCLSQSFDCLRDLKYHLKRYHPKDSRAWDTYHLYIQTQYRTFHYFGNDSTSGRPQRYSFVADNVINSSV